MFVFNCRDDLSDTSSIASQQSGSYDPNRTEFNDGLTRLAQQGDAIPTSVDDADINDGGIQLISAKTKPGEWCDCAGLLFHNKPTSLVCSLIRVTPAIP